MPLGGGGEDAREHMDLVVFRLVLLHCHKFFIM